MYEILHDDMENFRRYKNSSMAKTKLELKLDPFWKDLVDRLPRKIPPNLTTILAFSLHFLITLIILSEKINYLKKILTICVLFSNIIGTFLNKITGKQARRLLKNNPLMQLFGKISYILSWIFRLYNFIFCLNAFNDNFITMIITLTLQMQFILDTFIRQVNDHSFLSPVNLIGTFEAEIFVTVITFLASFLNENIWEKKIVKGISLNLCISLIFFSGVLYTFFIKEQKRLKSYFFEIKNQKNIFYLLLQLAACISFLGNTQDINKNRYLNYFLIMFSFSTFIIKKIISSIAKNFVDYFKTETILISTFLFLNFFFDLKTYVNSINTLLLFIVIGDLVLFLIKIFSQISKFLNLTFFSSN